MQPWQPEPKNKRVKEEMKGGNRKKERNIYLRHVIVCIARLFSCFSKSKMKFDLHLCIQSI